MRTTVTLDPDTESLLRREVARRRQSFKRVLNDAIRNGLMPDSKARPVVPANIPTFASPYRTGVDRQRLQQLDDALATAEFLRTETERQ
jgi:hypothetical protein